MNARDFHRAAIREQIAAAEPGAPGLTPAEQALWERVSVDRSLEIAHALHPHRVPPHDEEQAVLYAALGYVFRSGS